MIHASTRSQLLALPQVTDPETAAIVRTTWYGLCRAVHHHAYEVAPTAAELRGWHSAVTQLAHRLNVPANVSPFPGEE